MTIHFLLIAVREYRNNPLRRSWRGLLIIVYSFLVLETTSRETVGAVIPISNITTTGVEVRSGGTSEIGRVRGTRPIMPVRPLIIKRAKGGAATVLRCGF